MDIYFILIGNLLMDSAIAIFAILSTFVARYSDACKTGYELEAKDKEAISNLIQAKSNITNHDPMLDTMLDGNTKILEYLQKHNRIYSEKSLFLNPLEGKKLMILSTAFIDGIIFQIIGLFIL